MSSITAESARAMLTERFDLVFIASLWIGGHCYSAITESYDERESLSLWLSFVMDRSQVGC